MIDARIKFHPLTGAPIVPVGYRADGRPIWPIMGGSEPLDGDDDGDDADDGDGDDDGDQDDEDDGDVKPPADPKDPHYFPPNTRVAEMSDKEASNYWRHQAKVQQKRAGRIPDDVAADAQAYRDLQESLRDEHEVEVDEAFQAGAEAATRTVLEGASQKIMRSALIGRGMEKDDVDELMVGINPAAFINKKGDIDDDAILAFVDKIAPASETGRRDIGQGRGRGSTGGSSVQSGRARYRERHPARSGSNT